MTIHKNETQTSLQKSYKNSCVCVVRKVSTGRREKIDDHRQCIVLNESQTTEQSVVKSKRGDMNNEKIYWHIKIDYQRAKSSESVEFESDRSPIERNGPARKRGNESKIINLLELTENLYIRNIYRVSWNGNKILKKEFVYLA